MLSRTRPDPSNSTLITAVTAWRVSQVHLRSSATTFSPKGDKLYYIARATEGGANLFERNLRDGNTKLLIKGVSGRHCHRCQGRERIRHHRIRHEEG